MEHRCAPGSKETSAPWGSGYNACNGPQGFSVGVPLALCSVWPLLPCRFRHRQGFAYPSVLGGGRELCNFSDRLVLEAPHSGFAQKRI
jgi:hypothetical protein